MGLKNTKNRLEKKLEEPENLTPEQLKNFAEVVEELQKQENERLKQDPIEYLIIFAFVFGIASLMLNGFWNIVMVNLFSELPKFTFIQSLMVTVFIFLFLTVSSKLVEWVNFKLSEFILKG